MTIPLDELALPAGAVTHVEQVRAPARLGKPAATERTVTDRRQAWRGLGAAGALAAAVVGVSLVTLRWSVVVYLTADAAHYLADADALTGSGVRELRHAPLFPLLVAAGRTVLQADTAFAAAMAASLGLLVVALFAMLRRWFGFGPSLLGAGAAALLPTTAELLGWGGGATLLGTAFLVFSLAAMEAWVGGRRFGAVTGALLGASALAHPLTLFIGAVCLGARWLVLLGARRRIGWGHDPLGARGVAAAAALLLPSLAAAGPYYLSVEGGVGITARPPRLETVPDLAQWALGAGVVPWACVAAAAVGLMWTRHTGGLMYAATVAVLFVGFATALDADRTFVSRIAYVLPIPVAVGIGAAAERLRAVLRRGRRRNRRRNRRAAAAIGLAVLVAAAAFGFVPRLERASVYYELVGPSDLALLRSLADREGAVATSWHANKYGTGVSTSWFAEGVAHRVAYGPAAPWLSTIPSQRRAGLDMQRLFAGQSGIENGALQLSFGVPGMRADPAIQAWSNGFYFPVSFVDTLVNTYPVAAQGSPERTTHGSRSRWTYRDATGRPTLRQTATLSGSRVELSYHAVNAGDWSVWFWPPYGSRWNNVRPGSRAVEVTQPLRTEDIGLRVSSPLADVTYHRREHRFGVEAIEVNARRSNSLTIHVELELSATAGPIVEFGERALINMYSLSDVLVWKDTGWRKRFDLSPCYVPSAKSDRLLAYRVNAKRCGP